jgi:predicted acetyltransferase
MDEFKAEGRGAPTDHSMVGGEIRGFEFGTAEQFGVFVRWLLDQRREDSPRPAHMVASTTYWWVHDGRYLGRIAIRHRLTPSLLEIGGHIGYDVRPSARRQGHATAMLGAALRPARELGIESALITCAVENVASRRVIEANGGVLEDERNGTLRYWTPTTD